MYTKEEIREFLRLYKEIPVSRLKDVALDTNIRYEDDRFKKGGKLKDITDGRITIVSGGFKWGVCLSEIKRVWIEDDKKVDEEEYELERMEKIKEYLYEKYMKNLIVITKNKKQTKVLKEYLERN
jgi:hypothetical protein